MKDFINHIAYMISESGDTPSYDDIYTLCKKLGKEPDEDTMTREEYDSLSDEEKEEIHKTATLNVDFDDLDPDIDSDEYWKKFNDWKRKGDQLAARYDDEGLPVDPAERKRFLDGKKAKKRKEEGVLNAFLFVCEVCRVFSNKKYDLGTGGTDDNGERVSGQRTKPLYHKIGTMMFETVEEAKATMEERKKNMIEQFGLDKDGFKQIPTAALPHEITDEDLDAYGEIYRDTQGEGKKVHGKRGPKGKNSDGDGEGEVTFDKLTKEIFVEYIIYQSESFIKSSGDVLTDITKGISKN